MGYWTQNDVKAFEGQEVECASCDAIEESNQIVDLDTGKIYTICNNCGIELRYE